MQVSFNPQRQSFTAFTPAKLAEITYSNKTAEMFEREFTKGLKLEGDEVQQLRDIIPKLKEQSKLTVAAIINRVVGKFNKP